MFVLPIKSRLITEKDSLIDVILESLIKNKLKLKEKDILVITSKIASLTAGGKVKIRNERELKELIKKEADKVFDKSQFALTLKNNIFIPNGGIDKSNVESGFVITWPKYPEKLARTLFNELKKKIKIKNLGIIIIDSACHPLRKGVQGIALAYAGFEGIKDFRGGKDIFGKKLQVSRQNTADLLACSALTEMGEANEMAPFCLIREAKVDFTDKKGEDLTLKPEECLFESLY